MLRLFVIVPFVVVLIILMLVNVDPVSIRFIITEWKTSVGFFSLILGLVSFFVGALAVFISFVGQWKRARKAEQKVRELEKQLTDLQARYIDLTTQRHMNQSIVQSSFNAVPTSSSTENHEDITLEN